MERFACPSPDFRGRYRCIDDRSLCDGFFDCPAREDENPDMCLFYKTVSKLESTLIGNSLAKYDVKQTRKKNPMTLGGKKLIKKYKNSSAENQAFFVVFPSFRWMK